MRADQEVIERLQKLMSARRGVEPAPRDHAPGRVDDPSRRERAFPEVESTIDRASPSSDWDQLIDRVQDVAQQFRTMERRIQEREARVEQLLARAEEELNAAADRVRAAEARADEMRDWAEREVAAAMERAATAEGRASTLDGVFGRMREIVLAETAREAEVFPLRQRWTGAQRAA